jgi:hypothetical protein
VQPETTYAWLGRDRIAYQVLGQVGVGTIYQQVRSVPSRSEESFEVTAYDRPAIWRYEANWGRLRPVSPMPWTPFQRAPGSRTRSSWSSVVRAACSGGSPCHVSGTPWPPTSGSSRSCWTDRLWGTDRRHPRVSNGQSRQVNGPVDAC